MKTHTPFPMPPELLAALAELPSDHKGDITLAEARRWAHAAHAEVGQTYNGKPYGEAHLDIVEQAAIDWGFGDDLVLRILCQVHDVGEDTLKTWADMFRAGFSARVVILAWRLTDEDGIDHGAKKTATLPKVAEDWHSIVGKMCDRRANGRSSRVNAPSKYHRYCKQYPEFRAHLYDPNDKRLAHCWAELDELFGYVG